MKPRTLMLLLLAGCATSEADTPSRPNILFIYADDHAYQAIGAYGSTINKTPNIDRLAAEGMIFRECYVTNSICGPMRAVIQTGKYSHLNGFYRNGDGFNSDQQTFPKLLQKAGYQTAIAGKWHLGTNPQGYDSWEVLLGQGPYYNPPMKTRDASGKVVTRRNTGYTTDIITDLALGWLKNKRDPNRPFMLMVQHKAPHRNWQPGPKYLTKYDGTTIPEPPTLFDDYSGRGTPARTQDMSIEKTMTLNDLKLVPPRNLTPEQRTLWDQAYAPKNAAFKRANLQGKELVRWKYQRYIKDYLRCIDSIDENLGRVLDYLDASGLAENTVVIYSSDQGFYLGEHGWFDKRWIYEESLRTPLIVRWPKEIRPGSSNSEIVSPLDFAETFLDLAGAGIPADMQGHSLAPILRGRTPDGWRKSFYYHYYEYPAVHSVRRHYGVVTADHKLIHFYGPDLDEWELFDRKKDLMELTSVYGDPAYAGDVSRLKAELKRLQEQYGETDPEAPTEALRARNVKLRKVLHLKNAQEKVPNTLNPAAKPICAGALCNPDTENGVLISQGGSSLGYVLYLKDGVPRFGIRNGGVLREVVGREKLTLDRAVHLAGALTADGKLHLYVDGKPAGTAKGHFISRRPSDGLAIGSDPGSHVGDYDYDMPFKGDLNDIRVYWGVLDDASLRRWASRKP